MVGASAAVGRAGPEIEGRCSAQARRACTRLLQLSGAAASRLAHHAGSQQDTVDMPSRQQPHTCAGSRPSVRSAGLLASMPTNMRVGRPWI